MNFKAPWLRRVPSVKPSASYAAGFTMPDFEGRTARSPLQSDLEDANRRIFEAGLRVAFIEHTLEL